MSDLDEMNRKIEQLRSLNSVEEMELRWDADYADRYNDSRLTLNDPVELSDEFPEGLRALYANTNGARFGDIVFRRADRFRPQEAVDEYGEPIDDRSRIQIGSVGEDSVLLDTDSGNVMIYSYNYFKYRWDTGVVIECIDVPELVGTVALGPRYTEIKGPRTERTSPWWNTDPWYQYLQEINMVQ
jgi:hypothetical protein